jgi:Fe-S cluster biosynthesis and repair protein YggX
MYVFKKDTVDPKANSDNKLYGSDAYTPMFPADSIYSKKTVDYDDLDLTNELGEEIYFSVLRENRNQITDTQARDITEKIMNILQEDQASTEKEIRSAIEE